MKKVKPRRYWHGKRGQGKCFLWLNDRQHIDDGPCLIWPFHRHPTGYGSFGYLNEMYYAHRFMCELVHGPAPSPKHQASHSCGQGHEGCVHPKHLSWKTVQENLLDRRQHGTVRGNPYGWTGKLTDDQIAYIREMKGVKTQQELADMFGVKRPAIQYWQRHNRPPSKPGTSATAIWRRKNGITRRKTA